ncbi:substrate-binding periplasmic protein [Bradyrhizobium prioriisuperbiae]|uniref:substrate-binding periplasmic protein n=1 Tax=Bradyrhizobium prioriisuperbiae TaxID=2854389 RepID=UPI0028E70E43|nr:transporter substrate-binding domain-containing protein [Bradyrhizobium prioritasuperba]
MTLALTARIRRLTAMVLLLALIPAAAFGRTLDAIKARGALSVCAHANALPFASRADKPPGIQIEIARELARELGVGLEVAWVTVLFQRSSVNCDIVLDAIVDKEIQADSPVKVSKPYHRSGVALALPAGTDAIKGFGDLGKDKRIGVQVGSLAQMILSQRGLATTPRGFEDEMVEAVSAGELDGAAVSAVSIGYFNMTHPDRKVRLVHAYEQEPRLAWTVAVGMRSSDAALRERIDAAVDKLLAAGTIREIYARYGVEHRPP